MEISAGIFQLKVPLPNNSLGFINDYLVKTDQGCLLVDTGWKTDEAYASLTAQLAALGVRGDDLRYIVITHTHPDHYGLVRRLEETTSAELIIHAVELSFLQSLDQNIQQVTEKMNHWMRINGAPDANRLVKQMAELLLLGMRPSALPHRVVRGGEHLALADLDFEILWTPGHSAGHICLYEKNRRLLFAGDHILPRITPSVTMYTPAAHSPLMDYENSLQSIAQLSVDWVLPGHGEIFPNLSQRAEEILQHHEERVQEILQAVNQGPRTAYQIASKITWSTKGIPWENLDPLMQRMAIGETLAHLELLAGQKQLNKTLQDDLIWYS